MQVKEVLRGEIIKNNNKNKIGRNNEYLIFSGGNESRKGWQGEK